MSRPRTSVIGLIFIALRGNDMAPKWGHAYGARLKVFKLKGKLKGKKKQLVSERVDVTVPNSRIQLSFLDLSVSGLLQHPAPIRLHQSILRMAIRSWGTLSQAKIPTRF